MRVVPLVALVALSGLAVLAVPPASATDCLAQSNPNGIGVVCAGPASPSGVGSTCLVETFDDPWDKHIGLVCVAVSGGPGIVCVWANSDADPVCT